MAIDYSFSNPRYSTFSNYGRKPLPLGSDLSYFNIPVNPAEDYFSIYNYGKPNMGGPDAMGPMQQGPNTLAGMDSYKSIPNLSWDKMSGPQKIGFGLDSMGKVAGLFMGLQQYNLAKKSFDFQKDSFEKQYGDTVSLTNSRMEDRQRARVAAGDTTESVESYMERNRVGGKK